MTTSTVELGGAPGRLGDEAAADLTSAEAIGLVVDINGRAGVVAAVGAAPEDLFARAGVVAAGPGVPDSTAFLVAGAAVFAATAV